MTPDGALEPRTAAFLDSLGGLVLLGGFVLLGIGMSARLRTALAAGWQAPPPAAPRRSRWVAPLAGLVAVVLRLVIASFADIGLGDDGARVVWLQQWLQDPAPVWSGLWLPAHLYLHALFYLVVRDAVWAGVLLSACAAGGTVWILADRFGAIWGRTAALVGAIAATLLPISLAYGSNPDVNPVFAFFVVAAMAAVERGVRVRRFGWYLLGWLCMVTATWMRFDSIILVPAIALLLWPHRRAMLVFTVSGLLPLVIWNVLDSLVTHEAGRVVNVVMQDPTLRGSLISNTFSYLGALWQAVTLPVLVLGTMGMVRALAMRNGRSWILLPLAHAAALAGTTVVFQAGTQPRYFILIGTIFAAYTGVAVAGMLGRSRVVGFSTLSLAAVLFVFTPAMYPGRNDLWIRRDAGLRSLVDEVARIADGDDVVWVGESAYFYACRKRPPVDRYHGMPRADSDPAVVLRNLATATDAVACIHQTAIALERWSLFLQLAGEEWQIEERATRGQYNVYSLRRNARPDAR